jgi:pilus assembly protein CpaF
VARSGDRERTDDAGARHPSSASSPAFTLPSTWDDPPDHPAARARFVAQRPVRALPGYTPAHETAPHGVARITRTVAELDATAPLDAVRPAEPSRRALAGVAATEFGLLAPLVSDPRVTDVFVNGIEGVWADRGSGLTRVPGYFPSERELRALAVRLVSLGGRHIDEASPCIDARLGDGVRVHAVLPPISTAGTLLSIRLPSIEIATLDRLDTGGFFDLISRDTVAGLVARRENILITGAGGSGKTTLLCALLGSASSTERIIAIEDVAELRVDHPHFLSLEARQPNLEGAGALGLERLVREALRMRPDRLVLGECRGAEIREMLAALNTGHDGGAGTLHANSLEDVPARLEALGALAGMSPVAIARQTVSAIGTVLHLERATALGGERRLAQMGTFVLDHRDRLMVVPHGTTSRRGAHAAANA